MSSLLLLNDKKLTKENSAPVFSTNDKVKTVNFSRQTYSSLLINKRDSNWRVYNAEKFVFVKKLNNIR